MEIWWTLQTRDRTKNQSHYYNFTPCEFIIPALAVGLSLVSEKQQLSLSLLDSSQYSSLFQQCCILDDLDSSSDFQFLQSFFEAFRDRSKHRNCTITLMFHSVLALWQGPSICLSFHFFFFFYSLIHRDSKIHLTMFFLITLGPVFWPVLCDPFE